MKAINNYIIIQKIKEEPKKQNGLFITDNHTKDVRYLKGKIISVGNLTEGLKENDIIYYDRHAGHGIEYADTLYHVIRQQDVVIVA
jgi:co-chaperonin GroES (HSP10)